MAEEDSRLPEHRRNGRPPSLAFAFNYPFNCRDELGPVEDEWLGVGQVELDADVDIEA